MQKDCVPFGSQRLCGHQADTISCTRDKNCFCHLISFALFIQTEGF
jgi:hypothetical protein